MTDTRYDGAGAGDYPLNCWYVVAAGDEVGRSLLGREAHDRMAAWLPTLGWRSAP